MFRKKHLKIECQRDTFDYKERTNLLKGYNGKELVYVKSDGSFFRIGNVS